MTLALDHVSLQAPNVDSAVRLLHDRFGLVTTRTPAAPERHGRVYLDRSYLEVAPGAEAALAHFFLRYDRLDHTLGALTGRGLRARAALYEGTDGVWEDVALDAGTAPPLPFLTRRTAPAEVAPDWPPPLAAPHRCGATALAAVHLRVPRLQPALDVYERLLGSQPAKLGERSAVYRVNAGRIVLREATDLPPAIVGFELRVASLAQTRHFLSALGTGTQHADGALWADPANGWRLGFCEAAAGDPPRRAADGPAPEPSFEPKAAAPGATGSKGPTWSPAGSVRLGR
jgi:hypothetical protein